MRPGAIVSGSDWSDELDGRTAIDAGISETAESWERNREAGWTSMFANKNSFKSDGGNAKPSWLGIELSHVNLISGPGYRVETEIRRLGNYALTQRQKTRLTLPGPPN